MESPIPYTIEELSPYNYVPTRYVCAIFVALFALTGLVHLFQSIKYRMWWLIPTMVACGLCETIGWSGRLWSSHSPIIMDPFLMQICTTIIAPSFMTAAMFIILGRIIYLLGIEFSRLRPKIYTIVFVIADIAALVVQAVGGAMASMAETREGAERGANVMVGGIIVQMAAITVYVIVAAEYFYRFFSNKPVRPALVPAAGKESPVPLEELQAHDRTVSTLDTATPSNVLAPHLARLTLHLKLMLLGLFMATVFIYVRSIYRTIELLDGWSGRIISNETLFNVLDGTPILLAMVSLNVFHPGWLLPQTTPEAVASEKLEAV